MTTFADFIASKRETADLHELAHFDECAIDPTPAPGLIYLDSYYIATVAPDWTDAMRSEGAYYLAISNEEYMSNDLAELERILFDGMAIDGDDCDNGAPHDWEAPRYERNPTVCRRCGATL